MEIEIQQLTTNRYVSVTFSHKDTTIHMGMIDASERQELAKKLQTAAKDLLYGLPSKEDLGPVAQPDANLVHVLSDIAYGLERARIWGGMKWEYNPLHPIHYLPLRDKARAALAAIDPAA